MLEGNGLLQPGQWVRHPKFGDGLVLQILHSADTSDEDAAFVDFGPAGKKWLALRTAMMQRLFECGSSRWQQAQSEAVVRSMPSLPHLRDVVKPLTEIQVDAFNSRAWKQSLLTTGKRHRLQYKLEHGERIFPLVISKPLPWITHASLILPPAGVDDVPGYAGRRRAGTTRGKPTVHEPRIVVASTPPYKKLRGVLYDAVQGLSGVGDEVAADLKAHVAALNASGELFFEVFESIDQTQCLDGTKVFLALLRRRSEMRIQDLRATAHANGRWWPAPESFQVVIKADGGITARMRFTENYQSKKHPWIQWPRGIEEKC